MEFTKRTREQKLASYMADGVDPLTWPKATLVVDEVKYLIDTFDAYDCGLPVELPDGRIFQIGGWFETFPPQPCRIEPVVDLFKETLEKTKAVYKDEPVYTDSFAP